MHHDFVADLAKAAGIASARPKRGHPSRAFSFRAIPAPGNDPHAATEATIFTHGYSAGHNEEDRSTLLRAIPPATSQHARIFAFWNSSHFARFDSKSRRVLFASGAGSLITAAGDRALHFGKIRRRAERIGHLLLLQLEAYLGLEYPNVTTINLVGHSLGARLIVSSLKSIDPKVPRLVIKDVLLMAGAVEVRPSEARTLRGAVTGRLINAYSTDDWTLMLPVDESCLGRREVECFENVRLEGFGHCDYWTRLNEVLARTEFGRHEPAAPPATTPVLKDVDTPSPQQPVETDTMTIDLGTPSDIYQRINSELGRIVDALDTPTRDAVLQKAQAESRERLVQQQQALQASLDELEKNAEWNTFTIAFYGETGAGKSTLIETLRILLKDPGKVASQQAFRELHDRYRLTEEESNRLQEAIEQVTARLDALAQQAEAVLQLHEPACLAAQQALDDAAGRNTSDVRLLEETLQRGEQRHAAAEALVSRLQDMVAAQKRTLSWWQRMLGLFRKTAEEVGLAQAQGELQAAAAARDRASAALSAGQEQAHLQKTALDQALSAALENRDRATAAIQSEVADAEQEKARLSRRQEDVAAQRAGLMAELACHADGSIIGDGRADFTRETRRYDLRMGDRAFSLLDVPGIEGKEGLVLDQIELAVQKAHAVFYITNQAAPPQTGEGEKQRKGTLEKIKEHLGAQTEVWTIFNKKITNARALGDRPITSSDEDLGLAELDARMREHLGQHYRRTIPLTALPAFLASTDHLLPESQHARRRDRMLAELSREQLLQKSRLPDLLDLLGNTLLKDAEAKITRSNLNKARQALDDTAAAVGGVHRTLEELSTELRRDSDGAKTQLKTGFDSLRQRLDSRGQTLIDGFTSAVRKKIYAVIDKDVSDSYFKDALRDRIESETEALCERLPEALGKEVEIFRKEVEGIINRFEEQAQELAGVYAALGNSRLDGNFKFKIEIDNGIKVAGLVGGLVGLALAPFTGGMSLWISGFSVVIAVGKAVYKMFSTDYKKAQQRKATDENLRSASEKLRESLDASLKKALPQMRKVLGQINRSLDVPAGHAAAQAETLQHSVQKMQQLSLKIAEAGTH